MIFTPNDRFPEFRLIVAGGRSFSDASLLSAEIFRLGNEFLKDKEISIVCGMASSGADLLAVEFAQYHGVKVYEFPADWGRYGRAAGPKRNHVMAEFGDGLLAFWDGKSRGTENMINEIRTAPHDGVVGKPCRIIRYTNNPTLASGIKSRYSSSIETRRRIRNDECI